MQSCLRCSIADAGGYLLYPWIPPFWLAMYNGSVFSTEDHDLLRPTLLATKAIEQLTYECFERILSSNTTSNLEHAIFDRKWAWSMKMDVAFKNITRALRTLFNSDTPFLQTWIRHCAVRYLEIAIGLTSPAPSLEEEGSGAFPVATQVVLFPTIPGEYDYS